MKTSILLVCSFMVFAFLSGCIAKSNDNITLLQQQKSETEQRIHASLKKQENHVLELNDKCTQKIEQNTLAIKELSLEHSKNRNKVAQTQKKKKTVKKVSSKKKVVQPKKIKKKIVAPVLKPKMVQHNIGDRVCRHSHGLSGFVDINLVGVVESKTSENIRVKIIDSYGDNGQYVGLRLYSNIVVSDKALHWKNCKL